MVGAGGWAGCCGHDVLSPSVLMIRGVKVACGSRALVTADKGNDPPQSGRGLSQAWVRGPVVHRLALHPRSERRQERWISRTSRSSSVPGVGKAEHWATALSRDGPEGPRQGPVQRRGAPAALYEKLVDHGSMLVVVDQPATIRGPGGGGGPGHGHHRGLPARTVDAPHRRPGTG